MKVYIIHVKGNERRKEHIDKQLKMINLKGEFILEKNIEDLSEELRYNYIYKI